MNRRAYSTLTSVLYFVCLISLLCIAAHAVNLIRFAHGEKIFAGVLAVASGYGAACFTAMKKDDALRRKRMIKRRLHLIFLFYLIMLADFTLIDDSMGRNVFSVFSDSAAFREYIDTSTNFVPFATVRLFIKGYQNSLVTFSAMLENILGNFLAFMPLPFFLCCLFKPFQKWYTVLAAVVTSVITVELLQLILRTGACDIDDVILNVAGAMLFYAVCRTKTVGRGLSRLTFGVWNTENGERKP